jgi:hypothetical protein
MVEQIHRIVTDPGRLTRTWYEQVLASGIPDTEYVEIVGVVVTVVSIDTFCRALGIPAHPLPEPVVGEPLRRRPIGAMRVGSLDRRTATDGSDSVLGLDRAYESGSAGGSAAYLPCHGSMRICSDYLRDMAS